MKFFERHPMPWTIANLGCCGYEAPILRDANGEIVKPPQNLYEAIIKAINKEQPPGAA